MAEYTPSPQAVEAFKAAWHEADAEGDGGNRVSRGLAAALAQHDAELRAEVERLRATEGVCYHQNAQYLAMKAERDEARQQVADLRALLTSALGQYDRLVQVHSQVVMDTAEDRELHDRAVATFRRYGDAARTRLAVVRSGEGRDKAADGSGEPGEDHEPDLSDGVPDDEGKALPAGLCYVCQRPASAHRPAPVVPDSPGLRQAVYRALDDTRGWHPSAADQRLSVLDRLTDAVLAVVGQGVTVEWGVGYGDRHEAAPSREDAEEWIADDDAWNPGEERWLVTRQVGLWTRAAVRPFDDGGGAPDAR